MTDDTWPRSEGIYSIRPAGGNRFDVVRSQPTVIAKELRWAEAVSLRDALNKENNGR